MRFASITATLVISSTAVAQTTSPTTQSAEIVRFTLHPAAVTEPALQYPLLPPMTERRPGNAAVQYMIAANRLPAQPPYDEPQDKAWKLWNAIDEQDTAPIDKFSPTVAAEAIKDVSFDWIDKAARRDRVDWDNDFRGFGINTLLPQLNWLRVITNINLVRVRLDTARAHYWAADRSLQTLFAMTAHLNDQPVLVQALVGCGVARQALSYGVQDWIARGGPNLYWSLSHLPTPMINLNGVADLEGAIVAFTDPELSKALSAALESSQWKSTTEKVVAIDYSASHFDKAFQRVTLTPPELDAAYERLKTLTEPVARQHMRSVGVENRQIDSMSDDEIVGRFLVEQYQSSWDQSWKAWPLPFSEGGAVLRAAESHLEQIRADRNPYLYFIPNVYKARAAFALLDQQVAVLRVVEAVRDYAAHHEGRPPVQLGLITDLPLPLDPVSGKPFIYELHGGTAVVMPAAIAAHASAPQYEIVTP